MTSQLRFSVLVLPNVSWPELLRRCRHVEALGFDSVGLADHLVDWAGGKGPWFELWTQLAAIAQATTRIRLATLVAQIPLRNPALLASQALTADHVSGGRLDVGLGIGLEIDPSYRMMGIENWNAKGTGRPFRRVCRNRRPIAVARGDIVPRALLSGGCRSTAAAPRPVAAAADHDRCHGRGHAGACCTACRYLEQHQLRQDLRGSDRRNAPARGDNRRAVRGDRARSGHPAAVLSHARPDRSLKRRHDQIL
ncbi:LLM class flavin-dependent oxidoreductase [Reyranella sp. CPCC 100927]|nr:LLM class flavin-dependent oxidoreductase [Reyranella sp. CPCC 100927]